MKIIKLSATASTNTYLKKLVVGYPVQDGLVVVAQSQLAGRGQRGALWYSKAGKGLTFSVYKCFANLPLGDGPQLLFAVSCAVFRVLQMHKVPALSIKWPNDIMSYNKKLCGILIENKTQGGRVASSIIGVGLNVNDKAFPAHLPNATSMYLETGSAFTIDVLLKLLVVQIETEVEALKTENGPALKHRYGAALFKRNTVAHFESADGTRFNGSIQGVSQQGELIVKTEGGTLRSFGAKAVKMLF
ncbi:MAG: biotin--[acetyl-CoA-carboxylase] ligase [Marinirhabdus sp.]